MSTSKIIVAAAVSLLASCSVLAGGGGSDCPPDQAYFLERVWEPVMSTRCAICHSAGGIAGGTSMVLDGADMAGNLAKVSRIASQSVDGKSLLITKPTGGAGHGGGVVIEPGSAEYRALESFAAKVRGEDGACDDLIACEPGDPGPRMLRRLSRNEYDNTIRVLFGVDSQFGAALTPDVVVGGFDNNARALTVTPLLADQLRQAAESIASEVAARNDVGTCAGDGAACAGDFLAARAARIFRRPIGDEELSRWLAVYQVGAETAASDTTPHRSGMELMIAGMLQSPSFLYRSELGEPDGEGRYALTSYEIAAELSYLLWAEPPDDVLWAAAEADELRDPAKLEEHARRMLQSPKASAALDRFSTQWLAVDQLAIVAKDPGTYELPDSLRTAMGEEARRLFNDVVQSGGTLGDLLGSPYTIANAELAQFYGVAAPANPGPDGFGPVDLAGTGRAGVLGTGAFLTTHAKANSSSPIHRGKLVRERLLCQELPPPPPNVNAQPPAVDTTKTTRDRYAQHSTDEACASCHELIDPIGFAFEHFDGIGAFRADENGLAIDASGAITSTPASDGTFTGLAELSQHLASSPDVQACFATEWVRYGFGIEEDAATTCLIDDLAAQFGQGDLVIEELLVAVTQTSHFRFRKGEVPSGDPGGEDPSGEDPGGGQDPGGGGEDPGDDEPAPTGVTASYTKTSTWVNGYCALLAVMNGTDASVSAWEVTIEVEGTIYEHWNVEQSQSGSSATFKAPANGAPIAPGGTYEAAGFCANL